MFVVFLRFSENKHRASEFMEAHKAWIASGRADGVFLVVGSLQPQLGGAIIAHGIERAELDRRIDEDPFVAENVVSPEVFEISPSLADDRLGFVLG